MNPDFDSEKENTMKTQKVSFNLLIPMILTFVLLACGALAPLPTSTSIPAPTDTPQPSATITLTATNTPRPSPTPRPTKTPNLAATQHMEEFNSRT